MRALIIGLGLLAGSSAMAAGAGTYRAVFHFLDATGKAQSEVITSTAQGVSAAECDLKRQAWIAENGAGFDAIVADMAAKGVHVAYRVACERT